MTTVNVVPHQHKESSGKGNTSNNNNALSTTRNQVARSAHSQQQKREQINSSTAHNYSSNKHQAIRFHCANSLPYPPCASERHISGNISDKKMPRKEKEKIL